MVVREIEYVDFDGNKRKEKIYFNLTEKEVFKMQFGTLGGINEFYSRIIMAQDTPAIIDAIDDIVDNAYGVKTPDGRGFEKSDEITRQFKFTQMYSDFMMNLYTNDKKCIKFINELFPKELIEKIKKRLERAQKIAEMPKQPNSNQA